MWSETALEQQGSSESNRPVMYFTLIKMLIKKATITTCKVTVQFSLACDQQMNFSDDTILVILGAGARKKEDLF